MRTTALLTLCLLVGACAPAAPRDVREPAAPGAVAEAGETIADGVAGAAEPVTQTATAANAVEEAKVKKTQSEWREILTPQQFHILREKGTERPGSGEYDYSFLPGTYRCVGCGQVLFSSDDKYDSGCGWPAFTKPANETAVTEHVDRSVGMVRTEVVCSRCDGHLGHVFDDGPAPTGLRYCINSASLRHVPLDEAPGDKPK